MPIEVDPRFAGSGRDARKRRRKRQLTRLALPALGGVAVIGGVVALVTAFLGGSDGGVAGDDDAVFVQSEDTAETTVDLAVSSDVFLDVRGDPMIIQLPERGAGAGERRIVLSTQIHDRRARVGTEIRVMEDLLLDARATVQLTLPSSSADLAAFQARRASALGLEEAANTGAFDDGGIAEEGNRVTVDDEDGSWGTIVGEGGEEVSYIETSIGNITTQVEATRSDRRQPLFDEKILRGRAGVPLMQLMVDAGVGEAELARLTTYLEGVAGRLSLPAEAFLTPAADSVIALRTIANRPQAAILQMSFYAPDRYLTSLAQARAGRFEPAADPWIGENLLRRVRAEQRTLSERGDVRLKDALYSAALRSGLPSELVGELLVMLSRSQDLDRITGRQDRFKVVYAPQGGASSPAGQILYAALEGPDLDFKCYVLRPDDSTSPFGCYDSNRRGGGAGGGLGAGFVIPVVGTKTSGFGPRNHPILQRTVNHNGVDWAAPTGTPVKATAAGRVSVAGQGGGYGNVVYIEHNGGIESRYAHLDDFAPGIRAGVDVLAGELIGYVGTTGRSTGPHLHFEIHVNGTPVDPLALGGGGGGASGAVEALVAQIIRVESAGDARAKNPLSTATGLGQFIESTWLRMMRTYRPDLVATLSRAELLELRFDPALSRAMVTNLARENESFLRARGHAITPGRLYLAHFLGPAGASTALAANPDATVLDVMGASVVNANPFLRGKTVQWMTNWSDRKMVNVTGGTVVAASQPSANAPLPAEVKAYKDAVDEVLAAL
ncbi:MAG: peptidoglycan DD-metalloendopeptidase family protein [Pseudomonadota bacterium]